MNNPLVRTFRHRSQLLLLGWLCVSSMMSLSLLAVRMLYTETPVYRFLAWNLFLAWIPLFVALIIWQLVRNDRKPWFPALILAPIWLLFFPNAPYIVTDFIHLGPRQGIPLWYDLILLFSFAWNGLAVGFVSLGIMQRFVERRLGSLIGWLFALLTLSLSGFGIYLGRFLRWNSWDVFVNPLEFLNVALGHVTNPFAEPRGVAVTVLYSSFLVLAYIKLAVLARSNWREQ